MKFHLNIRKKVVVGLTVCLLLVGYVGVASYRYLLEIEKKQHLVEVADDLSNTILEIRRYEKNYLLYHSEDDLRENRSYLGHGKIVLSDIAKEIGYLKGAPQIQTIEYAFVEYEKLINQLAECVYKDNMNCATEAESRLREYGKEMVERADALVKFERDRILSILKTLEAHLLTSLLIFLAMVGFLIAVVTKKIIHPLKVIEQTTVRIAKGNFKPLVVMQTHDETQNVIEAFNRMIEELEKRQEQLLQARKLSSLGILTSGVAHQLNNPLNNISTSCQILLEEMNKPDPEFIRKMLTNIEQEVHRARDTVKGLLEFSREREFAMRLIPLSEVVDRSVRLISSQVPAGIEIQRDIPQHILLNMDAQKMQEAFLNLMINAIQAIENPPGIIKISAKIDEIQRMGVIVLEDTGKGIAEKDLNYIFDPFFTTKDVGAGTGLGLSIVYGIIQKHQGIISVQSRVGEGTRFIIQLPLYEQKAENLNAAKANSNS